MKVLLSPSKQMNLDCLVQKPLSINSKYFYEKLDFLGISNEILSSECKKAVKLYSGIAFRQLKNLDDSFYNNVIILSSLYAYSYGNDYISSYRLDYTTKEGRFLRKEMYNEINDMLKDEDVVYNLASKEFSNGIKHPNLISFDFYVRKDGELKQVSATSKKLRGSMVEFIRTNGVDNFANFNSFGFKYCSKLSDKQGLVFIKD